MYCKLMVICAIVVSQLSLLASSKSIKPQIRADFHETNLSTGDNYTVVCQGDTPLTWNWPDVKDENYSEWTTITTTNVLPVDAAHQYASRLFIANITFPFTGFFKCFDKNIDPADETFVSSIYLYVRDEEHLSVNTEEINTVVATQYSDAILPCRPTSPDVDVQLTLVNGEPQRKFFLGVVDEEGVMYNYDRRIGFSANNTKASGEKLYICNYTRDAQNFMSTIILEIEPYTHFIPKPRLEEISGGHTVEGATLVLVCEVEASTFVKMTWNTPRGPADSGSLSKQFKTSVGSMKSQNLTIHRASLKDKGLYRCNVTDNQDHFSFAELNVTIYGKDEHFINLTEDNNIYSISQKAGEDSVRWRINVRGHPEPTLFWLNNNDETILSDRSDKYDVGFSSSEAVLEIKHVTITDYGNYTLVAQNGFETEKLTLFLNVTDKPSIHLETDSFHMVNRNGSVACKVAAHPAPQIDWLFKPCLDNSCGFHQMNETSASSEGLQFVSRLEIKSLNSGFVKCVARNSIGEDEVTTAYHVTDVSNGFDVFGFNRGVNVEEESHHVVVAVGEDVRMVCGASTDDYVDVVWVKNSTELTFDERYRIDSSRTEYSRRVTLNLLTVNFSDTGVYSCQAKTKLGQLVLKDMQVAVAELSKPVIFHTNLNKEMEIRLPNQAKFYCYVRGVPKPEVTWYRNDELIYPSNKTQFLNSNQDIHIASLEYKDEGTYKCIAKNKAGRTARMANLKFKNKPTETNTVILWIVIAGLVVIAVVFMLCVIFKIRNERKLERELRIAGLANFEKGAIESLNPDLAIDDQAELLPYDKKWEFPIEKLKLGKQLGSGAFGVVMKGVAKGLVEGEESTVVAVKMVKKNADHTYIKALASELKIMVHLGQHLNVVNLLGACTKNVVKRELLVIVEFCRFGNLQNYLLRHREIFIDQVDPKTFHIDYSIGQEDLERSYSMSSSRSNTQSPYMKYAALSFSNSSDPQANMVDYRGDNYNGATTAKTDITTVSMSPSTGEIELSLSNSGSVQPEWRSNYHGDYKGNIKPICTKDLLTWAFQVSRGMEYLTSRRVLHGDLAARNILLADNNVVKICDFGLAKSMYKSDNYKKKGDGPLPVKWMAIESIRDKIFSTQSDVWSFGIVLWEFFSLAKTPYPGMEADERLYNKLLDGYRMETPEYAPKEIYKMMTDCWHSKPSCRPSFAKLSERIGSLLEDTVRRHYIDLNDPYLVMNTQRLEDGRSDYLAMLSPTNFENLSSPQHYINDVPVENTPGYLTMNSAQIFRPEDERIFSFDAAKVQKAKNSEDGTKGELLPMLLVGSDCESPLTPNSFSNPSYHLPPVVERQMSEKDIVKSDDNYVSMPQSKSALKDGNPFLNDKNVKEVNYVNSNSRDWESVKL